MSETTPRSLLATLRPRDDELRDPTRDELFNGPTREKLPAAIQQMAQDETACTFCGVSYFVFSEVQELQAAAKRYKKTFHEFVRFMERERKCSQELKAQVASLKKAMDDSVAACSTAVQNAALESQRLRGSHEQLTTQLLHAQQRDRDAQSDLTQLHAQWRRDEEEWKLASALTEQKLRNEIVHLGSQLEKCRLLSASQETEWQASLAREQSTIKQLELAVAATRASMATAERLVVTERDQLKQQLLAANERVTVERETAHQLETQLRAVQHELQRVVASSDSERAAFRQLNDDLTTLKLQLAHHEKAQAALASDHADVHEQLDKSNDLVRVLRAEIATLERKAVTNAVDTETHKLDYARELESMRLEHGQAINRMQRDHQKTLNELKQQHATYVEYLQQQTREVAAATQQGCAEMGVKLREAESQLARTTRQLQEGSDELQKLRLSHHHVTTRAHALERQSAEGDREKQVLIDELKQLQQQRDLLQAESTRQLQRVEHDSKARLQKALDDQQRQLQRQLDGLQTKCEQLRRENEQLRKHRNPHHPEDDSEEDTPRRSSPQQAWSDGASESRGDKRKASTQTTAKPTVSSNNQDAMEFEKLVEVLRQTIDQKDKEILLLQQTVHRECLERTSLLEKMKSGKVLPDLGPTSYPVPSLAGDASLRRYSLTTNRDPAITNATEGDDPHEERHTSDNDPSQPKASLYERLRRAGQRKSKTRKT